MIYHKTGFDGLLLISHKLLKDKRGFFKEIFRKDELEKYLKYKVKFCQENVVRSKRNVLRGLHFQKNSFAQSKLITVIEGSILDFALDIRKDSETYGKCFRYKLSYKNHESLFIPKGFAHGYLTLSQSATITYKVDNYYNPNMEDGILFNEKLLNNEFKIDYENLIISKKDSGFKDFSYE